ncbi:MAG: DNA repair protein RecO [Thiomonas sp.]|uniref:DNA repair protein RecO n=1 Tax=mine drainage metagenome TaxID=410659 RepID=E6PL51_9ZZZZ
MDPLLLPRALPAAPQAELNAAATPIGTTPHKRRPRGRIERAHDEPAYVLHAHPWKETSLILDVFSRHHGRLALVAKGAKRPTSQLRTVLLGFQPFAASWSGRGEVRTLTRADWSGGVAPLAGLPLLCGFYFNELLVRLLAREDAHETLFDAYHAAVVQLGADPHGLTAGVEPMLRRFEISLLRELGYLPPLDRESQSDQPVRADAYYTVDPQLGVLPKPADGSHAELDSARLGGGLYLGAQLLAMESGDWAQAGAARAAKTLMRELLHYHLGTQPLRTRQLLIDLHQL